MKQPRTFPLRTAVHSKDAMVYYGHLLGQAEGQMDESADRYASFALAWIAGDIASRNGKIHSVDIEGLSHGDTSLGDWSLSLRASRCPARPIELYRRQFLAEDGKRLIDLATPLFEQEGTDKFDAFCVLHLALHALKTNKVRAQYVLHDSEGQILRVELRSVQTWSQRFKATASAVGSAIYPRSLANR